MRLFETFESRVALDSALGQALEFSIDSGAHAPTSVVAQIPSDVQFQLPEDDFRYSSETVDPNVLDALIAESASWTSGQIETFSLESNESWRKVINHNGVKFHDDGYLVAERTASQPDAHSLLIPQRTNNSCHIEGTFTRPDHHYRYSFDVRIPTTESTWLTGIDGHWAILTELWGPLDAGEISLNPPFAIYTSVQNGLPYWAIRTIGDSRAVTTGAPEFEDSVRIPLQNLGQWHSWDVEYVPNSTGSGVVRVWLNGDQVAEWVNTQSSYTSQVSGQAAGPLNPAFGVYSFNAADGLEAHFDNIVFQCNGPFRSSISGTVNGGDSLDNNVVYATNLATGQKYGTYTERTGVFSIELPQGEYSISAVDTSTGRVSFVNSVSTNSSPSVSLDIELSTSVATFTGDLDGDGSQELINRLTNGQWLVTNLSGNSPSTSVWGGWSRSVQWNDVMVADFNGDGRDDIAGRAETGHWWVSVSTGSRLQNQYWGHWSTAMDWLDISHGDFNGDGRADIAGRSAATGDLWVSTSNGSRFNNTLWARWSTAVPWEVVYGDFNGDGRDDIAGLGGNSLWVSLSLGNRFETGYWGQFSNVGWSDLQVGDFNGDGRSDIIAMADSDGSWWVAESTGSRFQNRKWGRWSSYVEWHDTTVTDVDGDGRSDVVGRASSNGSWWIAKSNGSQFTNQSWGATWGTSLGWHTALIDDFDGDGKSDLLGVVGMSWLLYV